MLSGQFFRAGAGAIIVNHQGLVLALERADSPGAWQLPQGGLDQDEEPLAGAIREAAEETGIAADNLQLLASCPEPLAYELPAPFRSAKTGRGQVHYWFLFRYRGDDTNIDVDGGGEFRAWRWLPFTDLLAVVAEFRRPLYRRLAACFQDYLACAAKNDSPHLGG
jgi:putative (di)nucleoside polyphosphate hydrolase